MVVDSFLRCSMSPILGDKESPVQGGSVELLSPASVVFERPAAGVGSHWLISRNVMAAFAPTRLLPSRNGWFWQEMKQVRRRHSRNGDVQEFTAECRRPVTSPRNRDR